MKEQKVICRGFTYIDWLDMTDKIEEFLDDGWLVKQMTQSTAKGGEKVIVTFLLERDR